MIQSIKVWASFISTGAPSQTRQKKMVFQLRIAKKTIYARADWKIAWKADGDKRFLERCADYRKQVAVEAEKKRQLQVQPQVNGVVIVAPESGVRTRAKSRAIEDFEKFEHRRRTRSSGSGREADGDVA